MNSQIQRSGNGKQLSCIFLASCKHEVTSTAELRKVYCLETHDSAGGSLASLASEITSSCRSLRCCYRGVTADDALRAVCADARPYTCCEDGCDRIVVSFAGACTHGCRGARAFHWIAPTATRTAEVAAPASVTRLARSATRSCSARPPIGSRLASNPFSASHSPVSHRPAVASFDQRRHPRPIPRSGERCCTTGRSAARGLS
jgi:hypothetical protein